MWHRVTTKIISYFHFFENQPRGFGTTKHRKTARFFGGLIKSLELALVLGRMVYGLELRVELTNFRD